MWIASFVLKSFAPGRLSAKNGSWRIICLSEDGGLQQIIFAYTLIGIFMFLIFEWNG